MYQSHKAWKIDVKKFSDKASVLLECLRYAGIIGNLEHKYADDEDATGYFNFTIYAPEDVEKEAWANMNAKRMRSFMIRAKANQVD